LKLYDIDEEIACIKRTGILFSNDIQFELNCKFSRNQNHRKGQVVLSFPYPSKRDAKLREQGLDHFLYTLTRAWLPSPHRPNTAALIARSTLPLLRAFIIFHALISASLAGILSCSFFLNCQPIPELGRMRLPIVLSFIIASIPIRCVLNPPRVKFSCPSRIESPKTPVDFNFRKDSTCCRYSSHNRTMSKEKRKQKLTILRHWVLFQIPRTPLGV
jgi:hypothetical protein